MLNYQKNSRFNSVEEKQLEEILYLVNSLRNTIDRNYYFNDINYIMIDQGEDGKSIVNKIIGVNNFGDPVKLLEHRIDEKCERIDFWVKGQEYTILYLFNDRLHLDLYTSYYTHTGHKAPTLQEIYNNFQITLKGINQLLSN